MSFKQILKKGLWFLAGVALFLPYFLYVIQVANLGLVLGAVSFVYCLTGFLFVWLHDTLALIGIFKTPADFNNRKLIQIYWKKEATLGGESARFFYFWVFVPLFLVAGIDYLIVLAWSYLREGPFAWMSN